MVCMTIFLSMDCGVHKHTCVAGHNGYKRTYGLCDGSKRLINQTTTCCEFRSVESQVRNHGKTRQKRQMKGRKSKQPNTAHGHSNVIIIIIIIILPSREFKN